MPSRFSSLSESAVKRTPAIRQQANVIHVNTVNIILPRAAGDCDRRVAINMPRQIAANTNAAPKPGSALPFDKVNGAVIARSY